jgi:pyridoxine/pyridoxamine 5'-phosphate oxidase
MPTRGHPGTPRPTAGRSISHERALTTFERWLAQQEQRPATRDATAIRLARVRLHLYEVRLAALDTTDD